jgi:hypothetical protein
MAAKTSKQAPKTATKTAPKQAAPKAAPKAAAKQDKGLRKPQVRVLEALSKSGKALTRAQISDKAEVDNAMLTDYIGSTDDAKRKVNDTKLMPSLVTLGHVHAVAPEEDGGPSSYSITAAGRKALVDYNTAVAAKNGKPKKAPVEKAPAAAPAKKAPAKKAPKKAPAKA